MIREEIIQMIENVGVDIEISDNNNLHVEMDSLQFVALICDIENTYNISFDLYKLSTESFNNIDEFIEYTVDLISKK